MTKLALLLAGQSGIIFVMELSETYVELFQAMQSIKIYKIIYIYTAETSAYTPSSFIAFSFRLPKVMPKPSSNFSVT